MSIQAKNLHLIYHRKEKIFRKYWKALFCQYWGDFTQLDFQVQIWSCSIKKIQLRIFSVNVTKSAGNCEFGHIYWRNPWSKTCFSCSVSHLVTFTWDASVKHPRLFTHLRLIFHWYWKTIFDLLVSPVKTPLVTESAITGALQNSFMGKFHTTQRKAPVKDSSFLVKLPTDLVKRDSITGASVWILRNYSE